MRTTLADEVQAWTLQPRLGKRPADLDAISRRCARHPAYTGDATAVARYAADTRMRLRRAERISLDDDFVRSVVRLAAPDGKVNLPLIERALGLARAPFPVTWIEWSADAMVDEQVAQGTIIAAPDRPPRIGYLITASDDGARWRWTEWVAPPADRSWADAPSVGMLVGGVSTEPLSGSHAHPRLAPGGAALDANSIDNRARSLVGLNQPPAVAGWAPLNQLTLDFDEVTFAALFDASARSARGDAALISGIEHDVAEQGGGLRFLVFALALINSAAIDYTYAPAPAGRAISGGRSIPYLDYRTVTIRVPAGTRSVTRYLTTAIAKARRRAHQVRGHWRAGHVRRGRPIARQWVRPHQRGDASLGFVNQEHVVTT